jgi:hypothetical protein
MRLRQMSKMYAAVNGLEADEQQWRVDTLRRARSGDVGALCILRERYSLRLPLVEARLTTRLPWIVRGDAPAEAPGGRALGRASGDGPCEKTAFSPTVGEGPPGRTDGRKPRVSGPAGGDRGRRTGGDGRFPRDPSV